MTYKTITAAVATALSLTALPALAQSAGEFTIGLGVHQVDPKSDNGTLAGAAATIDSNIQPTITFEYFIRDNLGIELLAATPFSHDISLDGAVAGSTKHLPPVLSLQYHFPTQGKIKPFLGAGVNYTVFFDETASGALAGDTLNIDNSLGLALHAGFDYELSEKAALRADVRWIDIDADVYVNGSYVGTAEIDPLVYGLAYVMKF